MSRSHLLDYLEDVPEDMLLEPFVQYVRAWQQPDDTGGVRRAGIEATLCAMIALDPVQRIPIAVAADQKEPGPLPRLLATSPQEWITPRLAESLLDLLPSMDDRYRPLMLRCAALVIDHGSEDTEAVLLHLYGLRDAGEVEEAERLAKMALTLAEDAREDMSEAVDTLLSLLAEIAFDDGRFGEALARWQQRLEHSMAPSAPILNNCGAALQHMGHLADAGGAFLRAARVARRAGPGDPGALRALGSAYVNMAMQALERGRYGAALDLARRGTEHYRDLFDRHPRHSDNDIAELFFPLVNALDEAGLTDEAQTLLAEMLARARARYAEAPDIAATGLVEVLKALHQDALAVGRYDMAAGFADELRDLAKRHAGQPFSMAVTDAALALAARADAFFLDDEAAMALPIYEEAEAQLPQSLPEPMAIDLLSMRLNHAMALNDTGARAEAAGRIRAVLPEAEAIAPRNPWLWSVIARGYANLAIVDGERGLAAKAQEAIAAAEAAISRNRAGSRSQRLDAIEQGTAIANGFSHIGDYNTATRMLDTAIAESKTLLETTCDQRFAVLLFSAMTDLALIRYAAGDDERAASVFEAAVVLARRADPDSMLAAKAGQTLVNRAGALIEAERFDEAQVSLDEATPLMGPDRRGWTDYLNNRAALASGQGNHETALALFRQAMEAAQDSEDEARAMLNIAATLADLEQWPEVRNKAMELVDALNEAVVDPDGVDPVTVYFWLAGRVLAARGAAYVEPSAVALTETAEVLEAYHALAPAFDRDRIALHGYALEARGDALAAAGQGGQACAAWAEAYGLFESDRRAQAMRVIERLQRKKLKIAQADNRLP